MKSAYELAMERLEKKDPTKQLTAAQKEAIAEIESTYKARVAERELFLEGEIAKAMGKGSISDAEEFQRQLAMDKRRLAEECESRKAKAREAA